MGAILAVGALWALLVPPAQAPDEPLHFAYVQTLAETGRPPLFKGGTDGRDLFSTEQKLARRFSAYEAAIQQPTVRPQWRASQQRRWREAQADLPASARRDGGVENPTAGNPPLYYAWEAIPYTATRWSDLFARWYAMRLWSVLLAAGAAIATWLLVGEITARNRLWQLVAGAFVGLHPGVSAITAAINPDAAMVAVWAVVLWLGARVLRRGATRASLLALAGATLAALLTKATSFALLPAVGVVLAVAGRRALRGRHAGPLEVGVTGAVAVAGLGLAIAAGAGDRLVNSLTRAEGSPLGFLSYLWQAYLPNLPGQEQVPGLAAFWGYDVWVRSGWGNFGWSELLLPAGVYLAIAVTCVAIFAGAAVALLRRRFVLTADVAAFLGTAAAALVLGLHWGEYNQFVSQGLSLLQGRYLLPLLPIGGLAAVAALSNLGPRWRGAGAGALIAALWGLQVFELGVVVGRFHV